MATKSGKLIMYSVGAVLLTWVVSAVVGAMYIVAPSDAPASAGRTGETIALVLFAVTTTVIWLGVLVAVLVIAWKWFGRQPPAESSHS
jgi:hypothetical protein